MAFGELVRLGLGLVALRSESGSSGGTTDPDPEGGARGARGCSSKASAMCVLSC